MSNSKLVCYTKLSPNCNQPRKHAIDTISIHCMAGNCSIETCGEIFAAASRAASSNYGIGSDGRIALYVDESNRSWCTSSGANDHRAITIEVANDGGAPDWHVSAKALAALIDLCTDICRRNGIKKLLWKANKNLIGQVGKQNMTVHRWFANKACPGDYLYSCHGYIANAVSTRLCTAPGEPEKPQPGMLYRVQVGAYAKKRNADTTESALKAKGYSTYLIKVNGLYKVQVGAYAKKSSADAVAAQLMAEDFDTYITTNGGTAAAPEITEGCKVRVNAGANTYAGDELANFVYHTVYDVIEISGNRVIIGIGNTVTAAVNMADLTTI